MMVEEVENTELKQPRSEAKTEPQKTKKHRKWPWIVGIIVIILLIPILVLGYFGFVPGVSAIMGANKAKDLGIHWTAADYASYQQKTGAQFLNFANAPDNPNRPGKKLVFADPKQMDVNLTEQEIPATINSVGWLWMPIKNAQVRFGDGTVEISGNVNAQYIPNFVNFIGSVGYPESEVNQATRWAKLLGSPAIYIKASASVTNDVLTLNVTQAKVGRFSLPMDITSNVLTNGTGSIKTQATSEGYEAKNVTFANGQMHFVGTTPTTVYVKKN